MRIRLSDADRERLGCPEWIEYQPDRLMIDEAIEIQDAIGYGPDELLDAMQGVPLVRNGQPVLDSDGEQRVRRDLRAWQAVVWAALRRAGVDTPLQGLTFDLLKLRTALDEEPGKAGPDDQSTPPDNSDD